MTINLEKSLNIDAPVADVFAVWADLPSHPGLFLQGESSRFELTEQVEGQRLGWHVTGPDVASNVTLQFEETGDDNAQTKVILTAHYPNGIGASSSVLKVTSDLEASLANAVRILRGEALPTRDEAPADAGVPPAGGLGYPEVTASAVAWQNTLSTATAAWVTSLNQAFQVFSALAWWPLQGALTPAFQGQSSRFHQQPGGGS